ncbi:uncharacterized protein LOC134266256 [Saccostrea cucullata]|uniref:uncharacterized protein LOC134266256 n=1 Tax=Saccostrea cuccullata TaxID=36930 RepID=UPI002ED2C976
MDIPLFLYSFDNLYQPGDIYDLGVQAQYGFVCRLICKIFSGRNIAIATLLGTSAFHRLWCRMITTTKKVFCIQTSKKSIRLFEKQRISRICITKLRSKGFSQTIFSNPGCLLRFLPTEGRN